MDDFNKKVLIIGDSITEGILGINYVDMLQNEYENAQFCNRGLGGDTLYGISNRLIQEIAKNKYDIIIIEAGHNDIILPIMKKMNVLYKLTYHSIVKRGSIPITDPFEFEKNYKETITKIKSLCNSQIIITTLSCLSEDLNSSTNKKREQFNYIIRKISSEYNCILADVGKLFDDRLLNVNNSKQFLGNYFNVFLFDAMKTKTVEGAMSLSDKRNLMLTVDGVHINSEGAKIYFDVIKSCLKKLS